MIKLGRIVESYGAEGQFYDIGKDFANFRRMIDGADEQIKSQYEKAIASKLVGKRVRARASRGYKQFVKDYEFDVTKVTLDDYYDNFVVVAYDSSTPKPKEYFLKPGFKVQILGPATGQASPQKGGDPRFEKPDKPSPMPVQPAQNPTAAQSQPMGLAPATAAKSERPMDEAQTQEGLYDAYGMDEIINDIKGWLPSILIKPETAPRDFIKGLGWKKDLDGNTSVALFDLKIPGNMVKPNTAQEKVTKMVSEKSDETSRFEVVKLVPDESKGEWTIRIKKTTTGKKV